MATQSVRSRERKLIDVKDARIGLIFMLNLKDMREFASVAQDAGISDDFNRNKHIVVTTLMKKKRYKDLPSGSRSFISRCAALQKTFPEKSWMSIGREQYNLAVQEADMLWQSYRDLVDTHLEEQRHKKHVRNLLLRMSGYLTSFDV